MTSTAHLGRRQLARRRSTTRPCASSTCAGTWASPARDAAPTTPATCPERSSSTSTATWPTRPAAGPVAIPCPPRRRSRLGWGPPGSVTGIGSWPTTTSAAGSRRGCGGCSTTSGIAAVAVLDGGLAAWVAAGHPLTTDVPAGRPRRCACATAGPAWSIARGCARGSGACGCWTPGPAPAIAARSSRSMPSPATSRRRGAPRPTATSTGDGRFRTAAELADRYRSLGADGSAGPVVMSCGSGVAATHDALAMRVAGLPDALLYPGSYCDWTQAGLPGRHRRRARGDAGVSPGRVARSTLRRVPSSVRRRQRGAAARTVQRRRRSWRSSGPLGSTGTSAAGVVADALGMTTGQYSRLERGLTGGSDHRAGDHRARRRGARPVGPGVPGGSPIRDAAHAAPHRAAAIAMPSIGPVAHRSAAPRGPATGVRGMRARRALAGSTTSRSRRARVTARRWNDGSP